LSHLQIQRNTRGQPKRLRQTGRPALLTVKGKAAVVESPVAQRLIESLEKLKRQGHEESE
jgi:hypothetical protein